MWKSQENMDNILNEIKNKKWMQGVRGEDNPLIYSLKMRGENEYIAKEYGESFWQDRLLIPKNSENIRAIGMERAKLFHQDSKRKILLYPEFLIKKIEEDKSVLARMMFLAKGAEKNKENLLAVLELFKRHGYLFFLCFSLGLSLFENQKEIKQKKVAANALKKHDFWRNSVAEQEDMILNTFLQNFSGILCNARLQKHSDALFVEVEELIYGLKNGFQSNFLEKINMRKSKYAYLCMNGESKIIEDRKFLQELESFFSQKRVITSDNNILSGMTACKAKGKICGKVMIVHNPNINLDVKDDCVLVAIQTTPKYIPIMKRFKAIITDEGGITSHAAIIARELKIPCIVGTEIATKVLKNGDIVEVDTEKETVKIL